MKIGALSDNLDRIVSYSEPYIGVLSEGIVDARYTVKALDLINSITNRNRIITILGLSESLGNLRRFVFETANRGEFTDLSINFQERKIIDQKKLVDEIIGEDHKLLDNLIVVLSKARLFLELSNEIKNNQELQEIVSIVEIWNETIYNIVSKILKNDIELKDRISSEYEKLYTPDTRFRNKSYKDRLSSLLENPKFLKRVDHVLSKENQSEILVNSVIKDYLETVVAINTIRIIDRIQRPLSSNMGKFIKLTHVLEGRIADSAYENFIRKHNLEHEYNLLKNEISNIVNNNSDEEKMYEEIYNTKKTFFEKIETNIQNELVDEPGIDLFDIKEKVGYLKSQANTIKLSNSNYSIKKESLRILNIQLIDLITEITNKVNFLFDYDFVSYLVKNALYSERTNCSGKVSILVSIMDYLGISSRCLVVMYEGHVCLEIDLFDNHKLILDSTMEPKAGLKGNSRGSVATSYITYFSGETIETERDYMQILIQKHKFVRFNPQTGEKEVWISSIEEPHVRVFPDNTNDNSRNSSLISNIIAEFKKHGVKVSDSIYEFCFDSNPAFIIVYLDGPYISIEKRIKFLNLIKNKFPSLYYETISEYSVLKGYTAAIDHLCYLNKTSDRPEVDKIIEYLKNNKPFLFINSLYLIKDFYHLRNIVLDNIEFIVDFFENYRTFALENFENLNFLVNQVLSHYNKLSKNEEIRILYLDFLDYNPEEFFKNKKNIKNFIFFILQKYSKDRGFYIFKILEDFKINCPNEYVKEVGEIAFYYLENSNNDWGSVSYILETTANENEMFYHHNINVVTLFDCLVGLNLKNKLRSLTTHLYEKKYEVFWNVNCRFPFIKYDILKEEGKTSECEIILTDYLETIIQQIYLNLEEEMIEKYVECLDQIIKKLKFERFTINLSSKIQKAKNTLNKVIAEFKFTTEDSKSKIKNVIENIIKYWEVLEA